MNVTIQLPSRAPGLPQSFPYRRDTPVEIIIQRDQNDPPGPVQLDIVGYSVANGAASIAGVNELLASGQVVVRGEDQTTPGNSGLIQVRAHFNGQDFFSPGFSVCAHPAAIENGPNCAPHAYMKVTMDPVYKAQVVGEEVFVGMYIQLKVKSDSDIDADLDRVGDQELVSEPRDRSPSMKGYPHGSPEMAKSQRAMEANRDLHDSGFGVVLQYARALKGETGSWANDQVDIFVCERCGMSQAAVVPNSGYRIIRSISRSADGRTRLVVRKEARECSVLDAQSQKEYASEPGVSPPQEIELDIERVEIIPN